MDKDELRAILRERFPRERSHLLPALHLVHRHFGYLPGWALEAVSRHLRVPPSEVWGCATSYTELRTSEPPRHVLRVCTGLSCRLNGARELLDAAESLLHAERDRANASDHTGLEETPCGFLCAMAPVVQCDGLWRGRATPETVANLMRGDGA